MADPYSEAGKAYSEFLSRASTDASKAGKKLTDEDYVALRNEFFNAGENRRQAEKREAENEMRRETRGLATPKTYAKGGKVGSASKRADGIASKGKTKGRVI